MSPGFPSINRVTKYAHKPILLFYRDSEDQNSGLEVCSEGTYLTEQTHQAELWVLKMKPGANICFLLHGENFILKEIEAQRTE